jgi:3-methyl-2-oxobutanoate hydroxymethyltransferase
MKKVTLSTLNKLKSEGNKFTCLTAYDATFSQLISRCGVEVILVGDSLGNVIQGHDSTLPVTIDQMVYHTEAVKRGNQGAFLMADMPFKTFSSPEEALDNAALLMQAGAEMVKLEGGDWLCDTISQLSRNGIPSCVHLGLTPQSVHKFGGYKVQGRDQKAADNMLLDAKAVERAGADMLLLECVPSELGAKITDQANIPVIGIGAGSDTDAQVLVNYDALGLNQGHVAKFVRDFMAETGDYQKAIELYVQTVKDGSFPAPEHCFD